MHEPRRWQFSLRQLLAVIAVAAFTLAATVVVPNRYGSFALLVATLILAGVLATIAIVGGKLTRTFCIAAAIPIVFSLYISGWALGWVIFQFTTMEEVVAWLDSNGVVLKTEILSCWLCAGLAGIICVVIRRMLEP